MRSLGVIFLADIVGYSKMMAQDEAGTLAKLREFAKDVIGPTLIKHQGTMIKSLGDGWLIEFNSATTAVSCAQEWQSITKREGKMSLRVGIHLGDVEHEEGPPPDVYGDTVNIAARLESIAETGDVAISTSTYLCLDQNQAASFNNCGKQTLKNIATPVEVWSTGRLNVGSKGMSQDRDKPAISIKPFNGSSSSVTAFCDELTNDMERYLNKKDWIDSLIQKNPSEDDYQLIGSVSTSGPNFEVDLVLKAPGGKTLWNNNLGGPLSQISQLSDTVADQVSDRIFIEIMKVKDKYT
jgi:adenylate cyclase|tara:strand:+ start:184 stop:1068 length:885 start_codon:yes stop_codon:yes gene_type:complete